MSKLTTAASASFTDNQSIKISGHHSPALPQSVRYSEKPAYFSSKIVPALIGDKELFLNCRQINGVGSYAFGLPDLDSYFEGLYEN